MEVVGESATVRVQPEVTAQLGLVLIVRTGM